MTALAATARGQRFAEQQMTDSATITAPAGAPTFNSTTGAYTASPGATLYTGKCRVKPENVMDRQVQAGERPVQIWPYTVSVPMTVTSIPVGATVTVTASADPDLVGQVFTVKDVARGTNITARRLGCTDQEA